MDTLVEDCSAVMAELEKHNAKDLVNVNHVFERLENFCPYEVGDDRIKSVAKSFLLDLGLEPVNDGIPDVFVIENVEKSTKSGDLSVNGASRDLHSKASSNLPEEIEDNAKGDVASASLPVKQSELGTESMGEANGSETASSSLGSQIDLSSLRKESPTDMGILSPALLKAFEEEPFSPLAPTESDAPNHTKTVREDFSAAESVHVLPSTSSLGAIPKANINLKASSSCKGAVSKYNEIKPETAASEVVHMNNVDDFDIHPINGAKETGTAFSTPTASSSCKDAISEYNEIKLERAGSEVVQINNVDNFDIHPLNDVEQTGQALFSSPNKRSNIGPSNINKKQKVAHFADWDEFERLPRPKAKNVHNYVATLNEMFPEADPQYLWDQCEELEGGEALNVLIMSMLTNNDYPRVRRFHQFRNVSAAAGSERDLLASSASSSATDVNFHAGFSVSSVKSEPSKPAVLSSKASSSATASCDKSSSATSASETLFSAASSSAAQPSDIVCAASSSKALNGNIKVGKLPCVKAVHDAKISETNINSSSSSAVGNSLVESPQKQLKNLASLDEVKKKVAGSSTPSSEDGAVANIKAPPPREAWQDQFETFIQILPDADPSYLEEKARVLLGKEEELREFVANALENKEYPSKKDWLWRQEQLALQKKYTEEFSIPNFLEIIPDPFTYFADPKRQCDRNLGTMFLRHKYRKLRVADISSTFTNNKYNLTLTCRVLDRWTGAFLKGRRPQAEYDLKKDGGKGIDLPFLQEVAFIENESKIVQYLEEKKNRRKIAFDEAKAKGELLECQCCFDDEILSEDVRTCPEGHTFCVSCVQKSSESRIGDGHTTFPCLADCTAEFKLQTLQEILKPTVFSRMVQRKQAEEVKAAGIDDLVQCPFCDFCNIPPKEDKVFRCLNPECMKESCRLCKEDSHIPLRCDEVERKTEVELRTYIENKMTEALVRTCWQCSKKFVKSDGCNKMTCQCGALMCYVCRKPVKDYSHFNGQGGDAFNKCALYSNNDELHVDEVARVAQQAKEEALAKFPKAELKHDPTANLPTRALVDNNTLRRYLSAVILRRRQRGKSVTFEACLRNLEKYNLNHGKTVAELRELFHELELVYNVRPDEGRHRGREAMLADALAVLQRRVAARQPAAAPGRRAQDPPQRAQAIAAPRPQPAQAIAAPRPQPAQAIAAPRPQPAQAIAAPRPQPAQAAAAPRPQPAQPVPAPRPQPAQPVQAAAVPPRQAAHAVQPGPPAPWPVNGVGANPVYPQYPYGQFNYYDPVQTYGHIQQYYNNPPPPPPPNHTPVLHEAIHDFFNMFPTFNQPFNQ